MPEPAFLASLTPEPVQWRRIALPYYEKHYAVSSEGHVLSLRLRRLMRPQLNKRTGYTNVLLRDGAYSKLMRIHRLVAIAFLGPAPEGMVVNHKDANKANPRLSNLEYVSASENVRHALRRGLRKAFEENEVLTKDAEEAIKILRGMGWSFSRIGRALRLSRNAVTRFCRSVVQ